MRALVQRVSEAAVSVDNTVTGRIGSGLLILVGIKQGDTEDHVTPLVQKITALRIFEDAQGKMNRDVRDIGGALLIVSQFTLYAETKKGNRPSYSRAARAEQAEPLYESFIRKCRATGLTVATGIFGAKMKVTLVNEGPVTILCETDYLSA